MEEGLRSPDDLLEDLAIRSRYESPVMDLKEAHRGIAGTERYFDPERAPRQPTWRVMADLMLRRDGCPNPTGEDRRRYRSLRLGRADGDALLTELLPYPHPKASHWLYARFGRFATREAYEAAMLFKRRRLLRHALADAPHELIVCYGKKHWDQYSLLFDGVEWRDEGPYRTGEAGAARVVLTTHFSDRGFNTSEQLAAFAATALRNGTPTNGETDPRIAP